MRTSPRWASAVRQTTGETRVKDRKSLDITSSEMFWTALSCCSIGLFVGWAVFGEPNLGRIAMKDSSIAEWCAVVGAVVIGYGGWRYAEEGLNQRAAEIESHREQQRILQLARLRRLQAKVAKARMPFAVSQHFLSNETNQKTKDIFWTTLTQVMSQFESVGWESIINDDLPDEIIMSLDTLQLEVRLFQFRAQVTQKYADSFDDELFLPLRTQLIDGLITHSKDVHDQASSLLDLIAKSRREIERPYGADSPT
jgi:hypothetical protein